MFYTKNVKRLHYIIYYGKIMNITNRKEQFPNEESMGKFLVAIFTEYNTKNYNRAYKGFNKISIDS